jgi:hypothetical protein
MLIGLLVGQLLNCWESRTALRNGLHLIRCAVLCCVMLRAVPSLEAASQPSLVHFTYWLDGYLGASEM